MLQSLIPQLCKIIVAKVDSSGKLNDVSTTQPKSRERIGKFICILFKNRQKDFREKKKSFFFLHCCPNASIMINCAFVQRGKRNISAWYFSLTFN